MLRIFVEHMLWTPVPATCSREDRNALLTFYTQNKSSGSPFHFVTWNSVHCLTGRREGPGAVSAGLLPPPVAVLATSSSSSSASSSSSSSFAAAAAAAAAAEVDARQAIVPNATLSPNLRQLTNLSTWAAVEADGGSGSPPVTDQCLVETYGLLGNPKSQSAIGSLEKAFDQTVMLPLLKKCEIGLLLTGKCKEQASWTTLSTHFAAAVKDVAVVVPGTQLCLLDGLSTAVNSDVTSKHSLLSVNITQRTLWPVPPSCTTGDRQRLRQWLGQNPAVGCGFGAVQCFLTYSDDACGIQAL